MLSLLFLQIINSGDCEIISYANEIIHPLQPVYLSIPKFSPADAPHTSPGTGVSYVDMTGVGVNLDCDGNDCHATTLEVLIFKAPDTMWWMDYWEDREICCTKQLASESIKGCTQSNVNKMIIPSDAEVKYSSTLNTIELTAQEKSFHFGDSPTSQGTLSIKQTGLYIILMAVCNDDGENVKLNGAAESMDPYGYLPADLLYSMYFYGFITLCYCLITFIWVVTCYIYKNELIIVQNWISIVLILGTLETSLLYTRHIEWNQLGRPIVWITIFGHLCGIGKRALSRALVLMISLGYGVVRHSLGDDWHRILFICTLWTFLSIVDTYVDSLPDLAKSSNQSQKQAESVVVLTLAVIDASIYVWTMYALNNIIQTLESRKQALKLKLYWRFRAILVGSIVLSITYIIYVICFNLFNPANKFWHLKWTIDAYWEFTYFFILCVIAVLWAPSVNSQRYAYSIELSQMDNDEEGDGFDIDSEYGMKLLEGEENLQFDIKKS